MAPQLKEGDKMYFFIKNFKTKRPSKKLDHVKIGPFLIKGVKGPFDYELNLPADAKLFPIFNIFFVGTSKSRHTIGNDFSLPCKRKRRVRNRKNSAAKRSTIFHQMEKLWRDRRYLGTHQKLWELPDLSATVPSGKTDQSSQPTGRTNCSDTTSIKKMKSGKRPSARVPFCSNFSMFRNSPSTIICWFFSTKSNWRNRRCCFAYDSFNSIFNRLCFSFNFRHLTVSREAKLQSRPLLTQATHFSELSTIRHGFGTDDDKQLLQKRIAKIPIPKETTFCFRRLVELSIWKERFFGDKKYWRGI